MAAENCGQKILFLCNVKVTCKNNIGLFQKKSKWGLSIWNLQRYWRKNMWTFQGSLKNEVEFPGVFKKDSSGI